MEQDTVCAQLADRPAEPTAWGQLVWLVDQHTMAGAEQTFGLVTIYPGQRNALHRHPNCEELLYVISGTCTHLLGEQLYQLAPGSVIRIPRGVAHWARCTSAEPLIAAISFSAPNRQVETLEDQTVG